MAEGSDDIQALIALMARLPGLGPRSARRIVLALIRKRGGQMAQLAQLLGSVATSSRECLICGNITDRDECAICTDPARANGEICVVEDVADLWALERGRAFRGRYHVLGGTLSALDEIGPDDLGIPALTDRIRDQRITEVILALNATVDGQTTAHYIAEVLEGSGVAVTGLAQGVPIGGELDYLDDGTISAALRARRKL
ncbi:recombination protein RecR [Paracoccus sp. R12_1]|uniref:recombination mediator RecR n=1 Tax=unclassified Paracoccus (in: a-proteobacteria) TaxID=2688777 RepID=UPI001ADAF533|nr:MULTISPECIES: recombination mediator RecR [unclassified Paracoccus (in: a-proteobacteria)]MBO9456774.1 recombination protein RecR [Paracoccus sp. R12_2]MBO9487870.1 recombination protein RecR [Paracoccus sp. R12_1]